MTDTTFLYNLWYMAMPGGTLKPGKMVAKTFLNQPILLGRTATGEVFALRNICPHRGIPLSYGKFDGSEIQCCYHGWRFNQHGQCTCIPSLVPEQRTDISRIKVMHYPCVERQGLIWIFMPIPGNALPEVLPDIPCIPDIGESSYALFERMEFACDIDHAVVGLMDPAHGPFVHKNWWWRSQKSLHQKQKKFAPSELGFKMVRHKPSKNSAVYKILGRDVSTEISFRLPGIRIEHIKFGQKTLCGVTSVTPISDHVTEIHQFFYWTIPVLNLTKPFFRPMMRKFLKQDHDAIVKQQEGLKHQPQLMLINDADRQAKWYYALKKEYIAAQTAGRQFANPVEETTLHWCS